MMQDLKKKNQFLKSATNTPSGSSGSTDKDSQICPSAALQLFNKSNASLTAELIWTLNSVLCKFPLLLI